MFNMMGKIKEAKEQMELAKKALDEMLVSETSGEVTVTVTASRLFKNIELSDALVQRADKDELEDTITLAIEKAMKKAAEVGEVKMKEVAKEHLPNIPGLNL